VLQGCCGPFIILLFNSVLTGTVAFFLSTIVINCLGEIAPQAYFPQHALRTAARLSPVLRYYGALLFPATKPTAVILDRWLGPEGVKYLRGRGDRGARALQPDDDSLLRATAPVLDSLYADWRSAMTSQKDAGDAGRGHPRREAA
jgi:CBS domain containing-hemolysin-like protein